MGVELDMTNRARRAWTLMSKARLLDDAGLAQVKWDMGYERRRLYRAYVQGARSARPTRQARPCRGTTLLLAWDRKEDNDGRGDALALLVIKPFMSAAYQHDKWPDAGKVLGDAVTHLQRHFGRLDPPMSEMLRLRQGEVDLPLDGGSDTLRASTTWDVDEDGRLAVKHGDSFIQWTRMDPGQACHLAFDRALRRGLYASRQPAFRRPVHAVRPAPVEAGPLLARRCAGQCAQPRGGATLNDSVHPGAMIRMAQISNNA